jgi:hypothetical protein
MKSSKSDPATDLVETSMPSFWLASFHPPSAAKAAGTNIQRIMAIRVECKKSLFQLFII